MSIIRAYGVAAENSEPKFKIRAWYRNTTGSVVLYDSATGSSDLGTVTSCNLTNTTDLDTLTISYSVQEGTIDPTGTLWPYYGQTARIAPGCPIAVCTGENTSDDTSKEWLAFYGYIVSVSSDTIVARSVKSVLNTMYWYPANAYMGPDWTVINNDLWFRRPLYWWFNSTVPGTYGGYTVLGNPGSGWQLQSGKLGSIMPGLSSVAVNYPDVDTFSSGGMDEAAVRAVLQTERPSTDKLHSNFGHGSLTQVSFGSSLNSFPPFHTSGIDYLTPMRITYAASRTAEDKTFSLRWRVWPALGFASTPYQGILRLFPTNSAVGLRDPANTSTWGSTVSLDQSFAHYIEVEDADVSLANFEPGPGVRAALGQSWVDWFCQTTRRSSYETIGSSSYNSDGSINITYKNVAKDSSYDRFVFLHAYGATEPSFSDIMPLTQKLGYYGRVLWNTNNYGIDQITYPTSSTPLATGGWDNLGVCPCVPEFDVGSMTDGTSDVTYTQAASTETGEAHEVSRPDHQNQLDLINLIQADNTKWRMDSGSPYGGDSVQSQLMTQTVNRMNVTTSYSGYQFAFTQAGRALGVWCRKMSTLFPQTDYIPSLEILQNDVDLMTGTGTLTLGVPALYSGDQDWAPTYYRMVTKFLTEESEKNFVWKTYT